MSTADHLRVLARYAPELRLDAVLADPTAAESPHDVEMAAAQLGIKGALGGSTRQRPGSAFTTTSNWPRPTKKL